MHVNYNMIQSVSDTMPHLEPQQTLSVYEGADPPLGLTVDVVDEACRPWYVVHLELLFICVVYLYIRSSH